MNKRNLLFAAALAAGPLMSGAAFGQASAYRGLWVGEVQLDGVNEVSVPLDANNIPRAPDPNVATKTFDRANLRLILHVNGAGQVNLLKQVAILNRKAGVLQSENDAALVTDERLYGSFPPQPAQRIASVVFDFGDIKATAAVDAVVNAAVEAAAASVWGGDSEATAKGRAQTAATAVINSSDAAERYAAFLRDTMNTAAVTALAASGNATAAQDSAAAALAGSFYQDTRGVDMIAALEAAIAAQPAGATNAQKNTFAQNVAAAYADVNNNYQRFVSGELFGDMIGAAANAAAAAAVNVPRTVITAWTDEDPASVTENEVVAGAAGHGLATGDRISITGAPIGSYDGVHAVTRLSAGSFLLPGVTFIGGKSIAGYAATANPAPLTITSPGHGLQNGTRINISGAATGSYNGSFFMTRIDDDRFSIPVAFVNDPGTKGSWSERSGSITGYEAPPAGGSGVKVTSPGHGLNNGETIVIADAGATVYNGSRVVTRIDDNSFSIPVAFGGNPAAKGTWSVRVNITAYAEPAEKTTTVSSTGHGLLSGDRIAIAGSGKAAYNTTHGIERLDADSFIIPVLFVAADGNPATKGSWVPATGGAWKALAAIHAAADGHPKVTAARSEALSIKMAAYDDTRGTAAVNAVVAAIEVAAADAAGTTIAEILPAVQAAGRLAQSELVARNIVPLPPTGDYTEFVRVSDPRFTDFKEIAPIVAAAAAAGAAAEKLNVLSTEQSVENKAKERAIASITTVYATAARALRNELPMAGQFGPGQTGLSGTIILPANHPTNPFRHRRHPDHSTGFDITRIVTLGFDGAAGDSLLSTGYGVNAISGNYAEEIHGLHKPLGPSKNIGLKVRGSFTLHRISLIDALNAR